MSTRPTHTPEFLGSQPEQKNLDNTINTQESYIDRMLANAKRFENYMSPEEYQFATKEFPRKLRNHGNGLQLDFNEVPGTLNYSSQSFIAAVQAMNA